jgi:kinetochore protein Spc25
MSTFEPSLSTTMRASSHDAPSMADQLPSINFGFDDLRSRMNQFTTRFDAFIENGRRRVLEERNQFRMNVAELHGKCALRAYQGGFYTTQVLTTMQRTSV